MRSRKGGKRRFNPFNLNFVNNHILIIMKRTILLAVLSVFTAYYSCAKDYKVSSPDNKIILTVNTDGDIKFSVSREGREIISNTKIAMILENGKVLGENEKVRKAALSQLDNIIKPVVANKRSEIRDNCNILTISFSSGFTIQFRAYNDGVAYRFETALKDEIIVKNEVSDLVFPSGTKSWYPLESGFMSHNERFFIYSSVDTIERETSRQSANTFPGRWRRCASY